MMVSGEASFGILKITNRKREANLVLHDVSRWPPVLMTSAIG